eukprot:GFYU01010808.1.p1 GENE.GFYU01010808.1~~GFYU01010808.1.p1  ORF type:complete len:245 (-),score=80.86 GFYU01010808.1:88-822(-)
MGAEAVKTAKALSLRGEVRYRMGQYVEAEQLFMQSQKVIARVYGYRDTNMASARVNLGKVLIKVNQEDNAIMQLNKALALFEEHGLESSIDLGYCYLHMGQALRQKAKHQEADTYYAEAVEVLQKTLGGNHASIEDLYLERARNAVQAKKFDAGETLLELYLSLRKLRLGANNVGVADGMYELAQLYAQNGKMDEKLRMYKIVLPLFVKAHGENDKRVVQIRQELQAEEEIKTLSNQSTACLIL